eukprot:1194870-Prorocentrum_minimum.AAC.6
MYVCCIRTRAARQVNIAAYISTMFVIPAQHRAVSSWQSSRAKTGTRSLGEHYDEHKALLHVSLTPI